VAGPDAGDLGVAGLEGAAVGDDLEGGLVIDGEAVAERLLEGLAVAITQPGGHGDGVGAAGEEGAVEGDLLAVVVVLPGVVEADLAVAGARADGDRADVAAADLVAEVDGDGVEGAEIRAAAGRLGDGLAAVGA
jgi:hypothetical protein